MAVNGIWYSWMWADGGDDGGSVSCQINVAPAFGVALVSLSTADGEGLIGAGVTEFRFRNTPGGADNVVGFGWSPDFIYPPAVFHDLLSSVTATLVVGGDQQGTATLMLWQFS